MHAPPSAPGRLRVLLQGIPWVVLPPTLGMVALSVSYWLLDKQTALDVVFAILGLSHPRNAAGQVQSPAFEEFRTSFVLYPGAVGLHYVFMPLALLCGAVQFSTRLRKQRPRLHRLMGLCYLVCLYIGVGGILYKVLFTPLYGGMLSRYQFSGMAGMTLLCATLGLVCALRRDFVSHRAWMLRAYWVLWSSAIVSRLLIVVWLPSAWATLGGAAESYAIPYNIALFFSWAFALLAADVYLHLRPRDEQLAHSRSA